MKEYISVRQSGKFNNGFIFIICWFNFECKDKKSADPEDLRLNTAVVLLLWNVINFWKLVFPKKKKKEKKVCFSAIIKFNYARIRHLYDI